MSNVAKNSAVSNNLKKISKKEKNLKKITNACDEVIDKIQKLAKTRKIWKKNNVIASLWENLFKN